MNQDIMKRLRTKLAELYGEEAGNRTLDRLRDLIGESPPPAPRTLALSQKDVILITYGDQVRDAEQRPLVTLRDVLVRTCAGVINTVHILPFYPYSSDDGFSVIDYYAVDPALGTWEDVRALRTDFRLMFDAVFNHISAGSDWFQAFLQGAEPYDAFFITADPAADLSAVRRPRTLPLLTRFETAKGEKHLWTTFSDDQIDLNFANPDVLVEIIRVLLFYAKQGADLIRLDAIAYLWKLIGTSCIHLRQTHLVVQIMRDVLDAAAPHILLITETNVPHEENVSYFGDGSNEAQMVYQFPLPPLVLHTLRTGDARALSRWAGALSRPGDQVTFFNFTASHDGIGVQPARDILTPDEIDALVALTEAHGGFVSYKANSDGSRSPYELNINYFDAITDPAITAQQPAAACQRFICSQAIMLAFMGVPGIYFHSLFGSRSNHRGVAETGRYRTINREKLAAPALLAELAQPASIRQQVYSAYRRLLEIRAAEAAFHPLGEQEVLDAGSAVFALRRTAPDGRQQVLALHNVTGETVQLRLPAAKAGVWRDLVSGHHHPANGSGLDLTLAPHQVAWLKAQPA